MKTHKASKARRGFPIHAYVGPNGGGKSFCAVLDCLPTLAAGLPVFSTVRILDPETGQPHPQWIPLDSYKALLEVDRGHVILDEVTGVASARQAMSMPPAIQNMLVQLRRRDVIVAWTAPSWNRADAIIRECTQAVTMCQGFVPETVQHTDGDDRLWRAKRLFLWRSYDMNAFDEWSAGRREKVRPFARQFHWRPSSMVQDCYDTFDAVLSLGEVSEHGQCMDCGGNRPRPKCTCPKPEPVVHQIAVPETDDTPGVVVEMPSFAPEMVQTGLQLKDGPEIRSL